MKKLALTIVLSLIATMTFSQDLAKRNFWIQTESKVIINDFFKENLKNYDKNISFLRCEYFT